jgi:hypothetical protein
LPSFPPLHLSPDVHVQRDYFDAAVATADVILAATDDILASVAFVDADYDAALAALASADAALTAAAAFVNTDADAAPAAAVAFVDTDDTDFIEADRYVEQCIIKSVADAIISTGCMRPFKRKRIEKRACELAKIGRFAADVCEHPDATIRVEYCECECHDHNSDSPDSDINSD